MCAFRPPSPEQVESQVLINRLRKMPRRGFSLKAITASRAQTWLVAGTVLVGAAVVVGPWMWDQYREMLNFDFVPAAPTEMPHTSPQWWENEWRKMNTWWRNGDAAENFHASIVPFVRQQTGRDLSSAEAFAASAPRPHRRHAQGRPWWRFWARDASADGGSGGAALPPAAARALVPLCGDTPVMRTLALGGFEVDAVDASETALRAAVERTERGLPTPLFPRVHLHFADFFSPELWAGPLGGARFDYIHERQGLTSVNREERPDYAHLLKRALSDDGVMYVEGIYRTGRVRGNKVRGPPFSLTRAELRRLFPAEEGYFVRCEEKPDAVRMLSREDRLLRRVPKELYVTPFNCVVFREAAANLDNREPAPAEAAAAPTA